MTAATKYEMKSKEVSDLKIVICVNEKWEDSYCVESGSYQFITSSETCEMCKPVHGYSIVLIRMPILYFDPL